MGNEMGNTNSTSDQFQGAGEEGSTKVVQPAQGKPVVSVNDPGSVGALDRVNGGKGDHEEEEEESQQVHDGLPTAESPETKLEPDDDETSRRPDRSNLQPGNLTEEPEQLESDLVEQQEPFKQEEAERLISTSTTESPKTEGDETISKDSELKLHSLTEELEQHNLDLVEEQESFKQEATEMLNSASTAESPKTSPGSDERRSKESNLQSADLIEEAEKLTPDLVEGQEPCKQEEAEIPNPTTTVSSHDEDHMDSYELIESVPSQNDGNSSSTILTPQHEEHMDSGKAEPKKDHSSSIITESCYVGITGLENGQHLDYQTSHNPEGVLVPDNIMKEDLLENQPISPRAEIATEEESEAILKTANNEKQDQESENGSQTDRSIMPEYESNGSLNEAASEEQKTEVPQLEISTTDGSNKEQDSKAINQQRAISEIENGVEDTEKKEECEPELPTEQEKAAPVESEYSRQDSSSNSSWEFKPGNGQEFLTDIAPTFVNDQQEPVVTSYKFQGEEGRTKVVQPAQGKPVQQPVILVNDLGSDGAHDHVNGGKGDHEEEESLHIRDGLPTAESPETNPESEDEETRRPESNLQPEEAGRLTSTSTAESPIPEADETRSKDSELKLHSLPEELEQHYLDLVEEQESFKKEAAEMLNSTSTEESLETSPGSDETRSRDNNLQSADLLEEAEELGPYLVEGQKPCKQEEAEIPNLTTFTAASSYDEVHLDYYDLMESVPSQNEGKSSPTILSHQHEEHLDSGEAEQKKDHSSSIIAESSSAEITGLENGQHLDDHTSHNPEGILVPQDIIKEALLANQPISPRAEIATEEESENGSQIDCSIVPENESNGSLNEAASEEQKTELPRLETSITDSSNKEQDSEVINQQREVSEIENGGEETKGKEEFQPESLPEQEKKAPAKSEDSPQDSSSNSSLEFNAGSEQEFLGDIAPTFVADQQEPAVPFPIQFPAKRAEVDQKLGRLSTDSIPDNFSVNSKMPKSPSFKLHLRQQSTEVYSDQTPLLRQYHDKNTIIPPTKQTHTVESVSHKEAEQPEEKLVQTLERCDSEKSLIVGWIKEGDSNGALRNNSRASNEESAALVPSKGKEQKHYSRRRSSIFSSCLCCRATTAIN